MRTCAHRRADALHREHSAGKKRRAPATSPKRAPPVEELRAVAGLFGRAGPWRVHANFASCPGSRGSIVPVSPRDALLGIGRCRFTGSPNLVGRRAGENPPRDDIHYLLFLALELRVQDVAGIHRMRMRASCIVHGYEGLAPEGWRLSGTRCIAVGTMAYGEHAHAVRFLRLIERFVDTRQEHGA